MREGYVVGVDIGGTNLRLALTDMQGNVVARTASSTVDVRDAQVVVARIEESVDALLGKHGLARADLRAIAAGAPGLTNVDTGVVIATSYLMGWRDVPFRDLLEEAFALPAAVDNDVNVAALGESWRGAGRESADFVFLAIGTGVGSGIVLNGKLHRGKTWLAGEIGYMLVPGTSEETRDNGEPGGLESVAGGEGIRRRWQALCRTEQTMLPDTLTATEIFDAAADGDALAQRMLDETAKVLGYAIYNMWLVLNCPLVVMGGGIGMHAGLRAGILKVLEQRRGRMELKVLPSELGADAQLMGAVKLALETAGATAGS